MSATVQQLINAARLEQLTRPGEPFNAPNRVQRMADLLAALANALEASTTKTPAPVPTEQEV